jgi:glycosyltransferase involved in cell wall biosynthesis
VCEAPHAVDPDLRQRFRVVAPGEQALPDLDLYHLGNSPAHAFVYRAAQARPGVAVMHDWNLHYALLGTTVGAVHPGPYLHEMRLTYGERGGFVGRQIAATLGGDLFAALFPLNGRLLESSLAVVTLSRLTAKRARLALPTRPVLHLPLHFSPVESPPTRAEARRALGIAEDALIVTAPGLATPFKGLDAAVRALARLADRFPRAQLIIAGEVEGNLPLREWATQAGVGGRVRVTGWLDSSDFMRHLIAADVILALRFPNFGQMSSTLVRAMGVARPVLVTAGTPLAEEMPEGTVVPVDAGPYEEAELTALLARLLADRPLRETIGELACEHVRTAHELRATTDRLLGFLQDVQSRRSELVAAISDGQAEPGTLLGYFKEEIRWGARDLGLAGLPLGLDELLTELASGGRGAAEGRRA